MKVMTEKKLDDFLDTLTLAKSIRKDMELVYNIFYTFMKVNFTDKFDYQVRIISWILDNTDEILEEDEDGYDTDMFIEIFLENTVITKENLNKLFKLIPEMIQKYMHIFLLRQDIDFEFLIKQDSYVDWDLSIQTQHFTREQFNQIKKNQVRYSTYEEYQKGQSLKTIYNF